MVKASQLGSVLAGMSPQAKIGQAITQKALGQSQEYSREIFGYDFGGLVVKLVIYFTIALLFSKFMEAVIYTRGVFVTFANLFGINVPTADQIPDSIKKLFDGGIGGFKFWDLVKVVAILLITAEYFRYRKSNINNTSPMTTGIFVLLISVLAITTIPELIKRVKETDFNLEGLRWAFKKKFSIL